mmetsp:Transcript_94189/g.304807  ORF Transcript_94189/g.304807 Transcript_94189/m.304807 type:complete len:274 (-) Transcript_94189:812-1633(-)
MCTHVCLVGHLGVAEHNAAQQHRVIAAVEALLVILAVLVSLGGTIDEVVALAEHAGPPAGASTAGLLRKATLQDRHSCLRRATVPQVDLVHALIEVCTSAQGEICAGSPHAQLLGVRTPRDLLAMPLRADLVTRLAVGSPHVRILQSQYLKDRDSLWHVVVRIVMIDHRSLAVLALPSEGANPCEVHQGLHACQDLWVRNSSVDRLPTAGPGRPVHRCIRADRPRQASTCGLHGPALVHQSELGVDLCVFQRDILAVRSTPGLGHQRVVGAGG